MNGDAIPAAESVPVESAAEAQGARRPSWSSKPACPLREGRRVGSTPTRFRQTLLRPIRRCSKHGGFRPPVWYVFAWFRCQNADAKTDVAVQGSSYGGWSYVGRVFRARRRRVSAGELPLPPDANSKEAQGASVREGPPGRRLRDDGNLRCQRLRSRGRDHEAAEETAGSCLAPAKAQIALTVNGDSRPAACRALVGSCPPSPRCLRQRRLGMRHSKRCSTASKRDSSDSNPPPPRA